jgi:Asp-tRNA(Asn)/Glu-tRNA(Gln) amidotransferase A subunit family amidase
MNAMKKLRCTIGPNYNHCSSPVGPEHGNYQWVVYQALSRLTTVFDITGLPAMNIPGGFIEEERSKLPTGV